MLRIAYLANHSTPNGFYRGVGPMDNLGYRGHHVLQLSRYTERERFRAVREVDVFYVHRYVDASTLKLAREARAGGAAVVWDDDDDLGSFEEGTIARHKEGGLQWERRLRSTQAIFEVSDVVTAPSETLAERLRERGARDTAVVPNHIPGLFLLPRDRRVRNGMTVGWVAGGEHQFDAERLRIREVLQRLLDARPDVDVVSIGIGLGLADERYRKIKQVNILDLANHTSHFDIGLAPLADTPFNRSRSDIKLKEYAAGGAAWLASPVGPYARMGDREGGRLVPDDRWYEELVRLVDKPRDVQKLAKRGSKWVAAETLEKNGHRWEAVFARAVEQARRTAA